MHALFDDKLVGGYLDYYCSSDEYRIKVYYSSPLVQIDDLYFVRSKSIRLLINYFFEVGFRDLLRKVQSRLQETNRNQKCVFFGVGQVVEGGPGGFEIGDKVCFLAPSHPLWVERVVLPKPLIRKLGDEHSVYNQVFQQEDGMLFNRSWQARKITSDAMAAIDGVAGWSPYSGMMLKRDSLETLFSYALSDEMVETLALADDYQFSKTSIKTRTDAPLTHKKPKSAIVFGLGQYAKTNVIPNLHSDIWVKRIHEVDPFQIGRVSELPHAGDSSPHLSPDETYDIVSVAGFHHTHVPIAIDALKADKDVIMEKPIATSDSQLNDLVKTLESSMGRLFVCFQKRYSELNKWVFEDLGKDGPISYHCIVYEVPLPKKHWYNWPNSCSRLVSNGCHWIDHFFYLNNFIEPVFSQVWAAQNGSINCMIELSNGAVFSMVLTDVGSSRIGVQDHIELRQDQVTVKITNSSEYFSETNERIIRKKKVNKMHAYRDMYRQISEKIIQGESGDSIESILIPTATVLKLESEFQSLIKAKIA